jgi:putative acetyltransferase
MIELVRADSNNKDFIALVSLLDAELAIRDGDDHSFYHQFNAISELKHIVVALKDNVAVGCGAIKKLTEDAAEVKRMYVTENARGKGVAGSILSELENWAIDLGYDRCKLETGKKQPEAIALYQKMGYKKSINYGQYFGIANSLCFEKVLKEVDKT